MEEPTTIKKRAPSKMRLIGSITKDDRRVSIVGTVVDVDKNNMIVVLNDKSGSISVIFNNPNLLDKVSVGKLVRVIGLVSSFEDEIEINGEIVQDFSGLNMNYYYKYMEKI